MTKHLFALAAAAIIAAICGIASAATLDVRPTLLQITTAQRTAVLSLENHEQTQRTYQVRVYRWQQNGTEQTMEPTTDLIVSPPIVTLAPGQTQIVRVGYRAGAGTAAIAEEMPYRLVLDEIPGDASTRPAGGLSLLLRVSLPVFVRPQGSAPPLKLSGKLSFDNKSARVEIQNDGKSTARIVRATLHADVASPGRALQEEVTELRYILPTGHSAFVFAMRAPLEVTRMKAAVLSLETDQGTIDVPLSPGLRADANDAAAKKS